MGCSRKALGLHGPRGFKSPSLRQFTISEFSEVLRTAGLVASPAGEAERADLAFHTIAKIEAGATPNPTIDTVKKIADALGVSLDDLMKK